MMLRHLRKSRRYFCPFRHFEEPPGFFGQGRLHDRPARRPPGTPLNQTSVWKFDASALSISRLYE